MDDGLPITPSPPAATGVDQVVAAFWGICAERHTAGNSLELSRHLLGSPLSQSSWYNTRTQGSPPPPSLGNLCRASHRWEFLGIGSPSAWNTAAHSSWYNTRNQGPPSLPSSLESLGIGRLSARIDVAPLVWYNTRPPGFLLLHSFVRKTYLYHPVYCVYLAKNNITPTGIVF